MKRHYQRIAFIMAMPEEARPVCTQLGLASTSLVPQMLGRKCFVGSFREKAQLCVTLNGDSKQYAVASVGTVPAAISSMLVCEHWQPDLLISIGSAGALKASGASIADLYLSASPIFYHDRHIPFGDYEPYGHGRFPSIDGAMLAGQIGLKSGILSTGNSLIASERDRVLFASHGAVIEDMEAAAVAEVAQLYGIDMLAIKAITNFIDDPTTAVEEFEVNLDHAIKTMAHQVPLILEQLI